MKIVVLDELVQIYAEQLKRDDQVLSEVAVVLDPNDVVLIVGVSISQVDHYVQLYGGLVSELLLVADNLDRDDLTRLVI